LDYGIHGKLTTNHFQQTLKLLFRHSLKPRIRGSTFQRPYQNPLARQTENPGEIL
jgi:hypothetical protein